MKKGRKRTMSDRPELSVVLPAFNEGDVIEKALDYVDSVVRGTGLKYEIIVVDDGSVDDTLRRAADYAYKNGHVRVVGYERNMGKGYAIKTGFEHAQGDAVVFIDSDLEIDPEQIVRYFKALDHGEIVVASKWHPRSKVEVPLVRKLLSHSFNVVAKLLTGVRLRDTQTGLKAVRRSALEGIFSRLVVKRYAYDVELLAIANLYGLRVVELPVNVYMRGLFSLREVWRMFFDLLGITYRLRVARWYQRALK
jgi:glycosyltransferase involved in cell wall biosynthesis